MDHENTSHPQSKALKPDTDGHGSQRFPFVRNKERTRVSFEEFYVQEECWLAHNGFDYIGMVKGSKYGNLIHQFFGVNPVSNTIHMDGFQSIGDIFSSV